MKLWLSCIFCILLGGFIAYWQGPAIWFDFQLQNTKLERTTAYEVTEAKCKNRLFVLASCDVTLSQIADKTEHKFDYMLFGRLGGESVYALVDSQTNAVTTNVGVSHVWNRLLMLLVFCGLFVGGGLLLLFNLIFRRDVTTARLNRR